MKRNRDVIYARWIASTVSHCPHDADVISSTLRPEARRLFLSQNCTLFIPHRPMARQIWSSGPETWTRRRDNEADIPEDSHVLTPLTDRYLTRRSHSHEGGDRGGSVADTARLLLISCRLRAVQAPIFCAQKSKGRPRSVQHIDALRRRQS
ncbi:hypothetical protein BJV77DRAFT_219519 [Russula vinacea]|nr:hypothetical protein BJV77DRAFT_219519 [Russula vinacea]